MIGSTLPTRTALLRLGLPRGSLDSNARDHVDEEREDASLSRGRSLTFGGRPHLRACPCVRAQAPPSACAHAEDRSRFAVEARGFGRPPLGYALGGEPGSLVGVLSSTSERLPMGGPASRFPASVTAERGTTRVGVLSPASAYAELTFTSVSLQNETKLAVLVASVAAAAMGLLVLIPAQSPTAVARKRVRGTGARLVEGARRGLVLAWREAERLRRPRRPRCPFCGRTIHPDEGHITLERRRCHAECAELVVRHLVAPHP